MSFFDNKPTLTLAEVIRAAGKENSRLLSSEEESRLKFHEQFPLTAIHVDSLEMERGIKARYYFNNVIAAHCLCVDIPETDMGLKIDLFASSIYIHVREMQRGSGGYHAPSTDEETSIWLEERVALEHRAVMKLRIKAEVSARSRPTAV